MRTLIRYNSPMIDGPPARGSPPPTPPPPTNPELAAFTIASAGTRVISPTISFNVLPLGAVHSMERMSPALLLLFSYMSGYEPGDRPTILSSQFRVTLGVGLVVVLIAVGIVLFLQRGAHIELKGAILKVRTLAMSEHSSIAAVDFRFANPSSYPFVVRTVDVSETGTAGDDHPGSPVSEVDAK